MLGIWCHICVWTAPREEEGSDSRRFTPGSPWTSSFQFRGSYLTLDQLFNLPFFLGGGVIIPVINSIFGRWAFILLGIIIFYTFIKKKSSSEGGLFLPIHSTFYLKINWHGIFVKHCQFCAISMSHFCRLFISEV